MIDVLGKERHFVDHLAPVWEALGADRGTFYAPDDGARARALELGIPAAGEIGAGGPVLVASSGDLKLAMAVGRRVAMMEHGCGLSYGGERRSLASRSMSYAGGEGRDAVELFLHPGPHPAARDAARYPAARVEAVGSPRLDSLPARQPDAEPDPRPVVAVSFHWDTALCPETRSAFIYYRAALERLKAGFRVIGHGHPRIFDRLAVWYERHGIEPVRDFLDVCRRADLYAVDNSSTLYEFASTGRPVLVMNAPFYRRGVSHGLRFWEAADVGAQVDEPSEILDAARRAMGHPEAQREAALALVYSHRSGAAARAAGALRSWA